MRAKFRFLLGPAGSGKTCRCLAEIRETLLERADGPPLILLAPKQATFQLERQLLAEGGVHGYTRLHVLSFDRLARFVLQQCQSPPPDLLGEEGRIMVLRGILARRRGELKLFRASARLAGFAQELSRVLHELQRRQFTPDTLRALAAQVVEDRGLSLKLEDFALVLADYLAWLDSHGLHDPDRLMSAAVDALAARPAVIATWSGLWLDGFAELSPGEIDLLAGVLRHCERATIAFCLDSRGTNESWLSTWSLTRTSFENCKRRIEKDAPGEITAEYLSRDLLQGRFRNNPVLRHLERYWDTPVPCDLPPVAVAGHLRIARCADPEREAVLAAREILRFVRSGGRFREASIMVRKLDACHAELQRTLSRYGIPFFLDRREPVSHHPMAELTRSGLRLVANQWRQDDWFAALKTGLVVADDAAVDRFENEALARGWNGVVWLSPISISDEPALSRSLEELRQKIVPAFQELGLRLGGSRISGTQLAAGLRQFWKQLNIESRLEYWAANLTPGSAFRAPASVHATVWDQMNAWLDNVELAFSTETLSLREWLPILEAGLRGLTVGVIPPALDQVLVGAIDRSRNPDIRLALVLGLNETVFPAAPESVALLTDADCDFLERRGVVFDSSPRRQVNRERYYAYIACTRPRDRLVLTCAEFDADGVPLNASFFLAHVRQLIPSVPIEDPVAQAASEEVEHPCELVAPLMRLQKAGGRDRSWEALAALPALKTELELLRSLRAPAFDETLPPSLAEKLYGVALRTSVSRIEEFGACPFRFFVHSGLRAEERKQFELDAREQGTFQHEVLKRFHEQLHEEGKRWRDISPDEARERLKRISEVVAVGYRDGLFHATEEARFTARALSGSLQDFIAAAVAWMRGQYRFDPAAVELSFGEGAEARAWELNLGDGHTLALRGRIDRVDLCSEDSGPPLCVVVDYKSGQKRLDPLLMTNGLQLQLLAYLNVLRRWPDLRDRLGVQRIAPAGVFYINLRGNADRATNRDEALADAADAAKLAYQHRGRFDARTLRKLDSREDATQGDQFNYRLTTSGSLHRGSREALAPDEFVSLLDSIEEALIAMGRRVYSGEVQIFPYRKGGVVACDQCGYGTICRFDPWKHPFRVLRKTGLAEPDAPGGPQ